MPVPVRIVTVVGNPRPESRTHGLARTLAAELARALPDATIGEADLAVLGPGVLDQADDAATAAVGEVLAADVHFTPLLLELGAAVPARGLFVLESDVDGFPAFAAKWAAANATALAR